MLTVGYLDDACVNNILDYGCFSYRGLSREEDEGWASVASKDCGGGGVGHDHV